MTIHDLILAIRISKWKLGGAVAVSALGCSAGPQYTPGQYVAPTTRLEPKRPTQEIQTVAHQEPSTGSQIKQLEKPTVSDRPVEVDDLVRIAVESNPRVSKAVFAIDSVQGKYIQAGLYPNPELAVNWDEIGDRTGRGGILNIPRFTQQIVTANKLSLSQAVAATEIDQATLSLLSERYKVVSGVRTAFYDLLTLEKRIIVLDELVKLANEAVSNGKTLQDKGQIARLDLIQLEVELERFRAKAEASKRELPGAKKRLAAAIGDSRLPIGVITGSFDDVPTYNTEQAIDTVLTVNPEVRSAMVAVQRSQAAIRRAEVEVIPNLTFTTGFIRQYENRSNDFALGLSAPVPVWNRNQGNIRSAKADYAVSVHDVGRVENELAERAATALRSHASALKEASQYKTEILPKSEETYKLSVEAFKGGQFEYLRVIQAQRAVAEARLDYVRALGEAWKAAAELSGLLLEENWPNVDTPAKALAGPEKLPKPKPLP